MSGKGNWYNGFTPQERAKFAKATRLLIASAKLKSASPPCGLCGDPDAVVEYHAEDYAKPYRWTPPATYALCLHCHRFRLHRRFRWPELWAAFLAHVRRGGYASDLKYPFIRLEFEFYRWAVKRGKPTALRQLRPYTHVIGGEWFAQLRMDIRSLRDRSARPR
jgi:hypothetical protein